MKRATLPKITEKTFMAQVIRLARLFGWRHYHTHDSRRSAAGFPDLVLVRGPRLIFAELKTDTGKLSLDQQAWLLTLGGAGATARVWRPRDWSAIEAELRG